MKFIKVLSISKQRKQNKENVVCKNLLDHNMHIKPANCLLQRRKEAMGHTYKLQLIPKNSLYAQIVCSKQILIREIQNSVYQWMALKSFERAICNAKRDMQDLYTCPIMFKYRAET